MKDLIKEACDKRQAQLKKDGWIDPVNNTLGNKDSPLVAVNHMDKDVDEKLQSMTF